ncbi:MAG TPA: efflux RND transporter periplasmic adaptor subunit [Opitutaceae bacterium]
MIRHRSLLPVLAALLIVTGCRKTEPAKAEPAAALTVALVSPRTDTWPERIVASGSIEPWEESIIGAEIGGLRLSEVLVNVGDAVTKGQLLARFSDENVRMDLIQAEAALVEAEANLVLAKDQADRARQLNATSAMSRQDLLNLETAEKRSAARLSTAQAQLEVQRLRLRYTQVLAPDAGVISARSATVGAVMANGTQLFRLIRQGRLEWRAELDSRALERIQPGQNVEIVLTGAARLRGVVRQSSPVVSATTRSGLVYVDLPEPGTLKAGMFLSGEILLPGSPALHAPESVLVHRDGFQYVMKVSADRRVRQVKVVTGRRNGKDVELLQGVTDEDQLVASGGSFLNEGDLVRLGGNAAP